LIVTTDRRAQALIYIDKVVAVAAACVPNNLKHLCLVYVAPIPSLPFIDLVVSHCEHVLTQLVLTRCPVLVHGAITWILSRPLLPGI
jgi:hypothetical protein